MARILTPAELAEIWKRAADAWKNPENAAAFIQNDVPRLREDREALVAQLDEK